MSGSKVRTGVGMDSVDVGGRFGRWLVLSHNPCVTGKKPTSLCRCDCGVERSVYQSSLRLEKSKSCGCLKNELLAKVTRERNTTHGMSESPEYKIWCGMNDRCRNEKDTSFPDYGGRGIKVCLDWQNGPDDHSGFASFFKAVGPRPTPEHSIDRIDNDGDYEPGNVKWATKSEQAGNRRVSRIVFVHGQKMSLTAAINRFSTLEAGTVRRRIRDGWSAESALYGPKEKPGLTSERKRFGLFARLQILARQAICPLCGDRLGLLEDCDLDHETALVNGGVDESANLRFVHKDCHRHKTFGKGSKRGSDISEPIRLARLSEDHEAFRKRLSTPGKVEKPKSKWGKRPFQRKPK